MAWALRLAIAAQLFTSIVPIVVVLGTWLHPDQDTLAKVLDLSDDTMSVLKAAMGTGSQTATFGIGGALIVLASATSLSRALVRAYAAIWKREKPKTSLSTVWRWAAAVTALAASFVVVRAGVGAAGHLARSEVWQVAVAALADFATALFLPWVLMAGAIRTRLLVPAALTYATAMVAVRTAAQVALPHMLVSSANKYGAIGVALTFIAWLYALAFCFLAANVIGRVLATDESALGRWIQRESRSPDSATGFPGVS